MRTLRMIFTVVDTVTDIMPVDMDTLCDEGDMGTVNFMGMAVETNVVK